MKESEFILKLKREMPNGNDVAVEHFWKEVERNGTPFIENIEGDDENVLITFIWKGCPELRNVSVYGAFPGGDVKQNQLDQIPHTNVWFKSYVAKNDVLSCYYFSLDDHYEDNWKERWENLVRDPFNLKTFVFPKDDDLPDDREKIASILATPLSETHLKEMSHVKKGTVTMKRFYSSLLKNKRRIWMYTPYKYNEKIDYPLVLLFDGDMYTGAIPTPMLLDHLIANNKIPPVIAVLIDNPQRDAELPCNSTYIDFLTEELLPDLRKNFSLTSDPSSTVVGGSSLGGLAAAFAGFKRPDVFGNVLSQSGSFWWNPNDEYEGYWLADQFEKEQRLPLKFYLDVGIYEIEKMTNSNRQLHNVLKAKGYDLHYDEFSGGHDYLCWRSTLPAGLKSLLEFD